MPFNFRKAALGMKVEVARGTAESITTSEVNFRVRDVKFDPEMESFLIKYASGTYTKGRPVMGKRKATVKLVADWQYGAAADTAPTQAPLLLACGAVGAAISTTGYKFTPDSTKDEASYTMKFFLWPITGSGLILTLKGAMGDGSIFFDNAGKPVMFEGTFTGAFVSIADGAMVALTSPNTTQPPTTIGSTIVLGGTIASNSVTGGTAQQVNAVKLNFGNKVEMEEDIADPTGYKAAFIADRDPTLEIDPMAKLVATDGHYTRWIAGTQTTFGLITPKSPTLGHTLLVPKIVLLTNGLNERNGAVVYTQKYDVQESGAAGGDAWEFNQG